jgi:hypothetical protein
MDMIRLLRGPLVDKGRREAALASEALRLSDWRPRWGPERRKAFFFEKKEQKTFASWSGVPSSGGFFGGT